MKPEEMLPLIYDQLRQIAAAKLAHETPGQTLDPTALVHEAWLKLASNSLEWQDHTHFIRTAANVMRRILVDRARSKLTEKRGGSGNQVDLIDMHGELPDPDLLALDAALTEFALVKPEYARLVELRFFGGLTGKEAAEALNVSRTMADRMWRYSKAWLKVALES